MTVSLVVFDLGGVVIRIRYTWEDCCVAAGLAAPSETLRGRDVETLRRSMTAELQTGVIAPATFARRLSRSLDGVYTPQEILVAHDLVLAGEYEGIPELIEELNTRVGTACLSNTDAAHWGRINESAAIMAMGRHFVSHEMGLRKPQPAIFRAVESSTSVSPGRILFFDDDAENVDAARAAGWDAERVDPTADTAAQMRDACIERGVL